MKTPFVMHKYFLQNNTKMQIMMGRLKITATWLMYRAAESLSY